MRDPGQTHAVNGMVLALPMVIGLLMSPLPAVTVAWLLAATLACQQPAENWTLRQPYAAFDPAVAIHPTSGRPVVYGGSDYQLGLFEMPHLWEWTGSTWLRHVATPDPGPQTYALMATDVLRGQIVLCGSAGYSNLTWTWDGVDWRVHTGAPAVAAGALAYDSVRGRMVLFSVYNGTYEWDGNTWTLRSSTGPSSRINTALAFDAARGRTVLFGGGANLTGLMNDTWEWDGTSWTQSFPSPSPSRREGHGMGYDPIRQRVVLFGGFGNTDTWEWDGVSWTHVVTPHSPPPTIRSIRVPPLVFDRTRSRLTLLPDAVTGEIWEYDGVDWSQVVAASVPSGRSYAAIVDDPPRGTLVMFGGWVNGFLGDTWTWDGRRWAIATSATSPAPRMGHAMAHDPARGVALLFGGRGYAGGTYVEYDETWTWNGSWTLVQPVNRPPRREWSGLAYHAPSQRVLLFGGFSFSGSSVLGDTWTWDGTNWRQENPATSPPARYSPCMTGTGQNVVLFGGGVNGQPLADTWTWDGSNWAQLQPTTSPPAQSGPACTWDSDRGRVVLLNVRSAYPSAMDAWTFDGVNWTRLVTAIAPAARSSATAAYDPRRHELLLFGGDTGYQPHGAFVNDTWTLAVAGREDTFGAGCPGSLGTPTLQASTGATPEPGGVVAIDVVNLPMSLAMLAGGFSRTAVGSQPLPMSLASFGMPGCNLLVSPDTTVLLVGCANAARWSMPVPYTPGLLGIELYLQAFARDPAANAAGITASNGGRCRVGN